MCLRLGGGRLVAQMLGFDSCRIMNVCLGLLLVATIPSARSLAAPLSEKLEKYSAAGRRASRVSNLVSDYR